VIAFDIVYNEFLATSPTFVLRSGRFIFLLNNICRSKAYEMSTAVIMGENLVQCVSLCNNNDAVREDRERDVIDAAALT
jgi:hypothetical protein